MVNKQWLGRSISPYSLLNPEDAQAVYEEMFEDVQTDNTKIFVHGGPQAELRKSLGREAHKALESSDIWFHESYGEEQENTFGGENTLEELTEIFLSTENNDTLVPVTSDYHMDRIEENLQKFPNEYVILGTPWNSVKKGSQTEILEGLKSAVPQEYKDSFREAFGRMNSLYR